MLVPPHFAKRLGHDAFIDHGERLKASPVRFVIRLLLDDVIIELFRSDEEALTVPFADVAIPTATDIPLSPNKLVKWDLLGHGMVSRGTC
jgi:hypothetical protein